MHTVALLNSDMFSVDLESKRSDLTQLFPNWNRHDRFGIVMSSPFESRGASLLIQAAITRFYDWRRAHGRPCNFYPETVVIHAGGRWGDHSWYDFWPVRKELFVGNSAVEILSALNQSAVTRLALPYDYLQREQLDYDGTNELNSAVDRIETTFLYNAAGTVADANVWITATTPVTEENVACLLDPETALQAFPESDDGRYAGYIQKWLQATRRRLTEVAPPLRTALRGERTASLDPGPRVESFRRITASEAFSVLAPWDSGQSPSVDELARSSSYSV